MLIKMTPRVISCCYDIGSTDDDEPGEEDGEPPGDKETNLINLKKGGRRKHFLDPPSGENKTSW